ncbi:PDZ domain-containing protein [Blastopirellula sp. JC732]|uniref:PDZ domain-containing protein n=1 Tax=Blastopirellula sediminis TaxID=2894196 RepID=A0A9X1SJ39_9BACT|nr:PDZ domain-containing protein [Blastopirellula sediminis]MCC9604769.1 PDZ domain-containing protein [Blastopirellula sediminis]MCC9631932.1 PDZ domain-containing protein [Blastopirellula sediminis]
MRYVILTLAALLAAPALGHAQSAFEQLQNLIRPPGDPAPTPAPANPGYLGATLDNMAEDAPDTGVVVLKVNPGGPAEKAGLAAGDRVVSLETVAVTSLDQFARLMRNQVPGSRVKMTVERNGEPQAILVTLGNRPGEPEALPPPANMNNNPPATGNSNNPLDPLGLEDNGPNPPAANPLTAQRGKLGVRVVPVTDQYREATGASVRRGAVVESVSPGSAAAFAGIPVGSVIVALNNRRINEPADLLNILATMPQDRDVPIGYYVGNRLLQSNVRLDGQPPSLVNETPNSLPQQGPFANRPAMQMLNRALSELGANPIPSVEEQAENSQLRSRIAELEAEVTRLRTLVSELQAQKSGQNQ